MRIAVLSDIHGNLTAFEAVLTDLRDVSPDLVFHGGDLADTGSGPAEIVDHIRDLGWAGVMGNTDEMLVLPQTLDEFSATSSAPPPLWDAVREIAAFTRVALGDARLEWLRSLPVALTRTELAIVHATPEDVWRTLPETASQRELDSTYIPLGRPTVVFGHTHRPGICVLNGHVQLLINAGSVGLPYDGDLRASYVILDDGRAEIRRVAYDVEREIRAISSRRVPGADWIARMLRTASPQLP